MDVMKLLLHTCCAPCSIKCIETLRAEDIEPTLFWHNPNIHPYTEYRSRRNALKEYAKFIKASLVMEDEYGLRPFVLGVFPNFDARCEYCYKTRLMATAEFALKNGFDAFSTTLLISPYQNHDLIKQIGQRIADDKKVIFMYRDFRQHFRDGQKAARELGMYMQKYCGCVFSEEERYLKK